GRNVTEPHCGAGNSAFNSSFSIIPSHVPSFASIIIRIGYVNPLNPARYACNLFRCFAVLVVAGELMAQKASDTEELLGRAQEGDQAAREELLRLHRDRLRGMIAIRLDRRMAARVDPSDVVQEALTQASQRL